MDAMFLVETGSKFRFQIKFRDQSNLIARLDPEMREMDSVLSNGGITSEERIRITEKQKLHRHKLKDTYHNIAVQFAELHDIPGMVQILINISIVITFGNTVHHGFLAFLEG